MNIHEYQAKDIFTRYGIPGHERFVAASADEAFDGARQRVTQDRFFIVKAQVHAGARGKAGGVKVARTPEEVRERAAAMLGTQLVTHQTGPEGKPVDKVLIEVTQEIEKEYYASVVLDRSLAKPCLIVSEAGGVNIEEVAEQDPAKILKTYFSVEEGLDAETARRAAARLVMDASKVEPFAQVFQAMAKLFIEQDCSLVEINPLGIMKNGEVIAIDAKINFDENAGYRHPEYEEMFDPRQEDPRELEAKKFNLSYVGLTGNIGCIVNGAGLAMATMDIIKHAGGEPANFLDVGGGASKEKVAAAFKIILADPNVRAILVNIFGGIMRCDIVAEGILNAVREINPEGNALPGNIPLVVRLEGTNVDQGKALLEQSGLQIIPASTFEDAANKVVQALSS
jgi:succinyl-CoA synthetase beta subunit